jgi:proline iminopeptidase
MPSVPVHDTWLHCEIVGSGPPALVMHGGLGLDHTYLRPAVDPLADRLRLVYYDHRGNGRSGRPPLDTLTMEQLADDAEALAARLGFGRVLVIGASYGGLVAQELAVRHPGRVCGLVLVGTTAGQLGQSESAADDQGPPPPAELAHVLRHPPDVTPTGFTRAMRAVAHYMVHRADPGDLAAAFDRTVSDPATWRRSFEVLSGWSVADRLNQIEVPVLVLVGRHDVLSSPQQADRIARRLRHAEVVVFEDSGHALFYDEPARFRAVVADWLVRNRRLPAPIVTI